MIFDDICWFIWFYINVSSLQTTKRELRVILDPWSLVPSSPAGAITGTNTGTVMMGTATPWDRRGKSRIVSQATIIYNNISLKGPNDITYSTTQNPTIIYNHHLRLDMSPFSTLESWLPWPFISFRCSHGTNRRGDMHRPNGAGWRGKWWRRLLEVLEWTIKILQVKIPWLPSWWNPLTFSKLWIFIFCPSHHPIIPSSHPIHNIFIPYLFLGPYPKRSNHWKRLGWSIAQDLVLVTFVDRQRLEGNMGNTKKKPWETKTVDDL